MSEVSEPFELRITGPAARIFAVRLPEKIATAVHEFITTTLLDNPHRLGKRLLLPPYEGTWSARRGSYRVLYEIDKENRIVTVTAVEHRSVVELIYALNLVVLDRRPSEPNLTRSY